MIHLHTWVMADCTLGRLYYGGGKKPFHCFTLELPWRQNKRDVSCVPAGVYPYRKIMSPNQGREVLRIDGIVDRSLINMEAANYTSDSLGCIFPGESIVYMNADAIPDVTNSNKTLDRLLAVVPDEGQIDITRVGFYY